ncbi:uncharacterized protein LTR77_011086 [Saxophila tyrrhenica]|uniref:Uncharacterized protein n=1 Tax=Saxophila tyrrhenica TaxID=1690608 RepID=A0AAV9NUK4_9PEZI|nr:hypothetical protein LTR77_011086 [Saxophila tyrrhenica]
MPSSSSRATQLEQHLYHTYLPALSRLTHPPTADHATYTTTVFSTILDISPTTLVNTLKNNPTWSKLRDEDRGRTRGERLFGAGNASDSAAGMLMRVGRGEEGERFRGWAEELWGKGQMWTGEGVEL